MTLQIRAIPRHEYEDIALSQSGTMTLQIRAIPRHFYEGDFIPGMYHDITNPGNPQTPFKKRNNYRLTKHNHL